MNEVMTRAQACEYLGISKATFFRHLAEGRIPAYQMAARGGWRCRREELDRLVRDKSGLVNWRAEKRSR